MFQLTTSAQDGVEIVVLKEPGSGTFVEIIPACGAILHSFNVFHEGKILNLVDSYDSPADFRANVTSKGFKGCKLSPFACRVNKGRYHFAAKEFTIQKFFLGDNAIHGLIYDAGFTIIEQGADEDKAWVSMSHSYGAEDAGYPFKYDCVISYLLGKDNKLTVTTEIVNMDEGLIPMQDGWHPYFKFDDATDELQLEFQSKELVVFDEALIPTGELKSYEEFGSLKKIGTTELDHCFTVNFAECQPLCVLRHPGKKIQLEIYPTHSYPYLQVYTPPHRKSIALENLSAAPDAFNNSMGLLVMQPGEKKSFVTTYKITSLS